MFVLIAILCSITILAIMYYSAKSRESSYQKKYALVSDLRQLIDVCRQHRALSHQNLVTATAKSDKLTQLEQLMNSICEQLITVAHNDNKAIYRILQNKITKLSKNWPDMTVSQNQMAHGKSIRHCMFLIDEVVLAWLVESQQTETCDNYNTSWQQVVDGLEALTQFRIHIQDIDSESGVARLKASARTIVRRLNQLALISPLAVASPTNSLICKQLEEISESPVLNYSQDQLYSISTDISLVVFNSYDQLLGELAETIYQPFPKLSVAL